MMTTNTKLTLIDDTIEALHSGDVVRINNQHRQLSVKCHQVGVSTLQFLFQEVFPVYEGKKTVLSDTCPYCDKTNIKGTYGLKTHISKLHPEHFETFKQQYL